MFLTCCSTKGFEMIKNLDIIFWSGSLFSNTTVSDAAACVILILFRTWQIFITQNIDKKIPEIVLNTHRWRCKQRQFCFKIKILQIIVTNCYLLHYKNASLLFLKNQYVKWRIWFKLHSWDIYLSWKYMMIVERPSFYIRQSTIDTTKILSILLFLFALLL